MIPCLQVYSFSNQKIKGLYHLPNIGEDIVKSEIPKTNKCIVLDLDETLLHTDENEDSSTFEELNFMSNPNLYPIRDRLYRFDIYDIGSKNGYGPKSEIWGITRPHLNEFLSFCCQYFSVVAVWSAGQQRYVDAICQRIFRNVERPHIIYTRNNCQKHVKTESTFKPLFKLSTEFVHTKDKYYQKDDQQKSNQLTLENTFIIDDRASTFIENPLNAIQVPPYEPRMNIQELMQDDDTLLRLMDWFMKPEVIQAKDVRILRKNNIFTDRDLDPEY
jgi:TFIIF-interacting CTD phosphatase-like protein